MIDKRNILITGTKGFIGKNLLSQLIRNNNVFEITEDIFEFEDWGDVLKTKLDTIKPHVVFHVGAISNTLETDVNFIMIRNYQFTQRLVNLCKTFNIPIIYSSSASCYGVNGIHPSNLYGWSKYVGEQYVVSNGGIALRYFNVYGPGEEDKGTMSSVAYQMWRKHMDNQSIELFPNKPSRDFVHVYDVVNANIFAMKNFEELKGNYYEVGSGKNRTFEDVLEIMEIPYTYTDETKVPKGYQMYTKSIKEKWMKGWEPQYNLNDGLKLYKEYLVEKQTKII